MIVTSDYYWEWIFLGMDGLLGVAGMIITSDEMDHSRKFPAFSTSKKRGGICRIWLPHSFYSTIVQKKWSS